MADWSGGYVTDIEYSNGFHREQSPANLDLSCLLNSVAPPNSTERARYCDLGCGSGFTASILAAANPAVDFWGIDFNPAHIANGLRLQAETGLSNLYLRECAFSDLAKRGPDIPQFDYVAMHGVYSWIGEAEREAIVQFLYTHLKPGAVVYVGYNCLPNWAPELPLQRIFSMFGRFSRKRSDFAIESAIEFAKRVRDAGAEELDRPRVFAKLDNLLATGRQRYLAHEYLTGEWSPRYHEDVARELATAKLDYVGSAMLLENFSQLFLKEVQRELCAEIDDASVAETLKDYFMPRSFRSDIYVRGKRHLSIAQKEQRLRGVLLHLIRLPNEIRYEFNAPIGKTQLNEAAYRPAFDALSRGPMTVGELLDLPALRVTNLTPVELVGMLVGTGQALGRPQEIDEAARPCAAPFNAVIAKDAVTEREGYAPLAAPAVGSGLYLTQAQTFTYAQIVSGIEISTEAIAAGIMADFARRGTQLAMDGHPLKTPEETLAVLRQEVAPVLTDWVPRWRRLGVL